MKDMEVILNKLRERRAEKRNQELYAKIANTSFEELFQAFSKGNGLYKKEHAFASA